MENDSNIKKIAKMLDVIEQDPKAVVQIASPEKEYQSELWRCRISIKHWKLGNTPNEWEGNGKTFAEALESACLSYFAHKKDILTNIKIGS